MKNNQIKHDLLKNVGKQILNYMGFSNKEIKEEYTLKLNNKTYRVDLIGIKQTDSEEDRKPIIIECGNNKFEKIQELRKIYPYVLVLHYDCIFDYSLVIKEISKLFNRLETNYNENYNEWFKDIIEKKDVLNKEIKDLTFNLNKYKGQWESFYPKVKLIQEFLEKCKMF